MTRRKVHRAGRTVRQGELVAAAFDPGHIGVDSLSCFGGEHVDSQGARPPRTDNYNIIVRKSLLPQPKGGLARPCAHGRCCHILRDGAVVVVAETRPIGGRVALVVDPNERLLPGVTDYAPRGGEDRRVDGGDLCAPAGAHEGKDGGSVHPGGLARSAAGRAVVVGICASVRQKDQYRQHALSRPTACGLQTPNRLYILLYWNPNVVASVLRRVM